MPEMVNLYNANKIAVVTNVGPLVVPMSQAEYIGNSKPKPYALFSHSDQVQAWESGRADIKISTGWGGRSADAVATCNAGSGFPTITSIAGSSTFAIGLQRPLSIGTGLADERPRAQRLQRLGDRPGARLTSMNLPPDDRPRRATMIAGASTTTQQGVDIGADFTTDPDDQHGLPEHGPRQPAQAGRQGHQARSRPRRA